MQPLLLYSGDQYAGSSNESYFSKVLVISSFFPVGPTHNSRSYYTLLTIPYYYIQVVLPSGAERHHSCHHSCLAAPCTSRTPRAR